MHETSARTWCTGKTQRDWVEGRWKVGWGIYVNLWLIHVNVWQKPLQYCKEISLQLIKINEKKKSGGWARPWEVYLFFFLQGWYRTVFREVRITSGEWLDRLALKATMGVKRSFESKFSQCLWEKGCYSYGIRHGKLSHLNQSAGKMAKKNIYALSLVWPRLGTRKTHKTDPWGQETGHVALMLFPVLFLWFLSKIQRGCSKIKFPLSKMKDFLCPRPFVMWLLIFPLLHFVFIGQEAWSGRKASISSCSSSSGRGYPMGKPGAIQDPNNSTANMQSLPALPWEFPDRYTAQRCLFMENWVVQRLESLCGLFSPRLLLEKILRFLEESYHVGEAN